MKIPNAAKPAKGWIGEYGGMESTEYEVLPSSVCNNCEQVKHQQALRSY